MFDPTSTPDELLQPIANVLEAALPRGPACGLMT